MPVNVRDLIDEIVEDGLRPLAEEKSLELIVDTRQAPESLISDPLRLQQLVTNLVSNAIRYTQEGRVAVKCSLLEPDAWSLSVSDTGVGVNPEERHRIFDPYVQSEVPSSSSAAGSGLGLAIVQRIVTLMNGTIELVSEVGTGSTFTLTFPIAQQP
jgi:signal transduction histidine kinase